MIHRNFIGKVKNITGRQIYYGPFSTLKIPDTLYSYMTIGEILGTYESCLHPNIQKIIVSRPENILVIGANHGYYCAGLSYTIRPKNIIAYEMDTNLIEIAKKWWDENDLSPITFKGEATQEEFKSLDADVDLIICDCEGAEDDLLQPDIFTWQKKAIVITELHDFYRAGITQRLIERFEPTHNIELINDNYQEDELNHTILKTIPGYFIARRKIVRFPNHRWIQLDNRKVICSGRFLVMWPKSNK